MKFTRILLIVALLLVVAQAFSHDYTDQSTHVRDIFLLSQGLTPFVDFFEHHMLFYLYFYVPIMTLFKSPIAEVIFRLISIVFVYLNAYLIYSLVKRHKIGNPMYAALFFLLGYSGLPINFFRNEFFALTVILLYLYVKKPIIKGILVALLGITSLLFTPAAGLLFLYRIYLKKNDLSYLIRYLLGSGLVAIIFLISIINIPIPTLIYSLLTINVILKQYFVYPWYEAVFFSVFLAIPYFIGIYGLYKHKKKTISLESAILILGIFGVIILSSIFSGGLQKAKLPSYLPALVVLSLYAGNISKKFIHIILSGLLFLTVFLFTPAFGSIDYLNNQMKFNSCVSPDVKVESIEGKGNLFLYRQHVSHHWIVLNFLTQENLYEPHQDFNNPIDICLARIEKSDFICSDQELIKLLNYCENNKNVNLMVVFRGFVQSVLGFEIRLV